MRLVDAATGQDVPEPQVASTARVVSRPYAAAPAIPSVPSPARIDPFETHPASEVRSPTLDVLMGHYLSSFAPRIFPFYASRTLIELWWPFVREDYLLFHVSLLLSCSDLRRLKGENLPDDVRYQSSNSDGWSEEQLSSATRLLMQQSITELSARVQDQTHGITNHTLVSIACLAALEHDRDNMRGFNAHLQGLRKVVELRGGLPSIREQNSLVGNFVFWVAIVTGDEPSPKALDYPSYDWQSFRFARRSETLRLHTHTGAYTDLSKFGVDDTTAWILQEVQSLSEEFYTKAASGPPEEVQSLLSATCEVISTLLDLANEEVAGTPVSDLSRSCRIAGCLHIFTPMSGYFPKPTMLLHAAARDLKSSLIRTMQHTNHNPQLLLWLHAVGGVTAHSMVERSWFVGHLVVLTTDMRIDSWETFRAYLVELAFHNNFCEFNFNLLWLEVQQKKSQLAL